MGAKAKPWYARGQVLLHRAQPTGTITGALLWEPLPDTPDTHWVHAVAVLPLVRQCRISRVLLDRRITLHPSVLYVRGWVPDEALPWAHKLKLQPEGRQDGWTCMRSKR